VYDPLPFGVVSALAIFQKLGSARVSAYFVWNAVVDKN